MAMSIDPVLMKETREGKMDACSQKTGRDLERKLLEKSKMPTIIYCRVSAGFKCRFCVHNILIPARGL